MRTSQWAALAGLTAVGNATSLADICTTSYAKAHLPADSTVDGITIDPSSVSVAITYNASFTDEVMFPDTVISYCNLTFAYSHNGLDDQVYVAYWLPSPSDFQNRFLATGGGGLAINSGSSSLAGGLEYGAVSGLTDGGFGTFDTQWDATIPLANGTNNWPSVYNFGYQSIHEMSLLGKALTNNIYGVANSSKVYSYYQACSEGGREGWSQVQRFPGQYDGAIIGAPAIRYSFQQVNHLTSNIVEQTLGYYPPPCELEAIMNLTVAACDGMDGKEDGVVSRSDLCKLNFNINTTLGQPYYCAAASGFGSTTPEQNGTISAKAIEVATTILGGLKDSEGRQVYFSYQPGATWTDAATEYNTTSGEWQLDQSGLGGEWVERFLKLQNASVLPTLDGVTYDSLKAWMIEGYHYYSDSLQTDWPDLNPYQQAGGKVLHFHGEQDYSIPTASSVRYHESVRKTMYPELSFNASQAALSEWYKLFLIPGGSHCDYNTYQPNGPWPQTNLAVMIDWVEKGVEPVTLNATILQGEHIGDNQQVCEWPLRPHWTSNSTANPDCIYDQASIDNWHYDLDAIPLPIY